MQKSTFSVNFFIRRTRLGKSGETPIMMRISVDGRYTELSTQRLGLSCGLRQTITHYTHTASKRELARVLVFVLTVVWLCPNDLIFIRLFTNFLARAHQSDKFCLFLYVVKYFEY